VTEGEALTTEQALTGFYKVAVGVWKIAPSEFWAMTPDEWWWLWEVDRETKGHPLTAKDIKDELRELDEFALLHGEKYRTLPNGRTVRSNPPPPGA